MKIKTWIKYYEGYLPPRCRKLRYRECEDYVDITLAEATLTDMSLAFEDNSYEGKGKIYYYDGRLWAADSSFNRGFHKYKSALEKSLMKMRIVHGIFLEFGVMENILTKSI